MNDQTSEISLKYLPSYVSHEAIGRGENWIEMLPVF